MWGKISSKFYNFAKNVGYFVGITMTDVSHCWMSSIVCGCIKSYFINIAPASQAPDGTIQSPCPPIISHCRVDVTGPFYQPWLSVCSQTMAEDVAWWLSLPHNPHSASCTSTMALPEWLSWKLFLAIVFVYWNQVSSAYLQDRRLHQQTEKLTKPIKSNQESNP